MGAQSLLQIDLFLQVSGMTPGRAATILPAVLGLNSVITGWWALVRSARRTSSMQFAGIIALLMGFTGVVFSVLHLIRATGGFGTGSGRLGAIVALVLGLTGMVSGGLAVARSRRITKGSSSNA